jgi:hypothetical protein
VFSVIRLLILPMTFVGYRVLEEQGNPMTVTVPWEMAAGIGIALGGVVGNGLMLARQKFGIYLGYLLIFSVLGSIGVGIWQAGFVLDQYPEGSVERTGAMGGMAVMIIIRLGILGAYTFALLKFSSWINSHSRRQAF